MPLNVTSFTCIVVRWYRRILKEVEDVVSAFDKSFLELSELLCHVFKILCQQSVKLCQPRLFVDDGLRILVAFMDGLLQQAFDLLLRSCSLYDKTLLAIIYDCAFNMYFAMSSV